MPRVLAWASSNSVRIATSWAGPPVPGADGSVHSAVSAVRARSRQAYSVGREAPLARLTAVIAPYAPSSASKVPIQVTRSAGVLGWRTGASLIGR